MSPKKSHNLYANLALIACSQQKKIRTIPIENEGCCYEVHSSHCSIRCCRSWDYLGLVVTIQASGRVACSFAKENLAAPGAAACGKSTESAFKAQQIISLNPQALKKYGCG